MNISYGPRCIQVRYPACETAPAPVEEHSEDCLFLDVYVPRTVFGNATAIAETPVVVWIFGGAYVFGGKQTYGKKDPLYDGKGLIHAAKNYLKEKPNVIFVAGNYRLGALGWLAGPAFQHSGIPAVSNAGLYDQRLLFEWVQKYIGLFGGDKTQVSAWGESAGGGSILHHLVRTGTEHERDPLFKRALLQSPAYQWQWDRSPGGEMDQTYRKFMEFANCNDMHCLLNAPIKTLIKANQDLFNNARKVGLFPVGPAVDDVWISELPTTAFANGKWSLAIVMRRIHLD